MISPTDTAYPVLTASPSAGELTDAFTPDVFELKFAEEHTREATPRVGLLTLLKTFQRLGYFVKLADIPLSIIRTAAQTAGYDAVPSGLDHYDQSTLRVRHMALVRSWTGVSAYDRSAFKIIVKSCVEASRVREDLADIINIAIEELLRKRYELPAFTTLLRAARTARATVNWSYYSRISQAVDPQARTRLDALFDKADGTRQTPWETVKNEPGQPTMKRVKRFLETARWLKEQAVDLKALAGIPVVKLQRFAVEARGLNASRMRESQPDKRYAYAAALIQRQRARALDDAADMLIRLVQRMQNTAKEKLLLLQSAHLQQSGDLAAKLRDVGLAYLSDGSEAQRLQTIGSLLGPDVQGLLRRCEECVGLATGNHFRLLPQCFGHPRQALLALLENLPLCSTSQDRSVVDAVAFVLANQNSRATKLSVAGSDQRAQLDLSFVSDAWWPLVTGLKTRSPVSQIDRRLFELCVVAQVANDLKSGGLCIPEGDKFRDYRHQLLPWEKVERELANYGEQAGIATEPKLFVMQLRNQLEERGRATDKGFPDNRYLRFEDSAPILTPLEKAPDPENLDHSLSLIKERLEPIEILDAFADTEHWLHWTRHFGPLSGLETKLKRARERYLLTVFCYGCNLGPVQTARSVRGVNRFQLAFINQRHLTEQFLNAAITTIVNAYVQFPLQTLWGTGQSASADGMKWNLYPQNLMSEYHIRYGGYGGIGYYLVADNYIALMSRWTTCGAWEGHAILDFLKENESDVKPDTIHADTQGQSNAIFGLAYLLGIQLLPRIRNWKERDFYRPSPESRFEHIDSLFTAQVDWDLIEAMRPELLRVAVSIKSGVIRPSDILRRLGSYSRKNKLYFALRELGRVVRTMFLLRYISEVELRQAIQAATNKSERFNEFVQWISFGGDDVIAENIRDEQRKFIKYNHLVANILAFHNLVSMTKAIDQLKANGQEISNEVLAALSPYLTSHINRFGQYQLQSRRAPGPLPLVRKPPKIETAVVSPNLVADGDSLRQREDFARIVLRGETVSTIQNISFMYDPVGNITQITDYSNTGAGKTEVFGYDPLNRLVSASTTAASSTPFLQTFSYDLLGNITNKSDRGPYVYGGAGFPNPDAPTSIGGVPMTYDNNGNLTSDGTLTNSWDYLNRLTQSGNGGATTTYAYDFTGDRVKMLAGGLTTLYPNMYFNTALGSASTTQIFANGELVATVQANSGATGTPATSTPAYVQGNFDSSTGNPVTLPGAVTNGDLVVVSVTAYNQSIPTNAVSDNKGNTYTRVSEVVNATDHAALFYAANVTGGSSFTVSKTVGGSMAVQEYSGIATSSPLDQSASATSSSAVPSSGSVTTTIGKELYVGLAWSNGDGDTWTQGYNYTLRQQETNNNTRERFATEDKVETSGTTTSAYFTTSSSNKWAAIIATFKPQVGTSSSAGIHYVHNDQLSGSNVITDSSANVEQVSDYYPFGTARIDQRNSSFNEQRKYAGTIRDDSTGLDYMQARYYSSSRGDFLSEDPVAQAIGDPSQLKALTGQSPQAVLSDPQVLNFYSYAGNNPIAKSDPTGRWYKEFITGQQSWPSFQGELNAAAYQLGNQSATWNFSMTHPVLTGGAIGLLSAPVAIPTESGVVALGQVAAPGVSLAYSAARAFEGSAYLYLAKNAVQTTFEDVAAISKANPNQPKSVVGLAAKLTWDIGPTFTNESVSAVSDVLNLAISAVNNLKTQIDNLAKNYKHK